MTQDHIIPPTWQQTRSRRVGRNCICIETASENGAYK